MVFVKSASESDETSTSTFMNSSFNLDNCTNADNELSIYINGNSVSNFVRQQLK